MPHRCAHTPGQRCLSESESQSKTPFTLSQIQSFSTAASPKVSEGTQAGGQSQAGQKNMWHAEFQIKSILLQAEVG